MPDSPYETNVQPPNNPTPPGDGAEPLLQPPTEPKKPETQPPLPAQIFPQKVSAGEQPLPPGYQNQGKKHWLRYTMLIILLAAIIAGAYFLKHKNSPAPAANQSASDISGQSQTTVPSTITATTKTYTSTAQNLSFDYPSDWTVSEATGEIKATSPAIQLTSAAGQNITGQIVLDVRVKTAALPEFDAGSATAALDSQKITYTKPTQAQRAQTYISFYQYNGTTTGIDGIYVTGNTGYKAGQVIAKADFAPADPKIDIVFNQCADKSCLQNPTHTAVATSVWTNTSISTPLTNIFKSFAIN